MWPAILISCLALLFGLLSLSCAAHTWRHAPGARLWRDLQGRIEDLEHDNQQLHDRLHKRARVENVTKATTTRVTKREERDSAVDEAEAVLANIAAARPAAVPADPDAQLMHWRKVAGLSH